MTSVIIRIPTTGFRILCQWNFGIPDCNNWCDSGFLKLYSGFQSPGARSIRPNFPETSVQNSMDRFGRSNRKSFKKTAPFEVDHFSRSDPSEFWLNGSRPWISDSTEKNCSNSGFHKQKFPRFRNPNSLTWEDNIRNAISES